MDVRKVNTLPILRPAQYGNLPEIPEGKVLVVGDTWYQKAEPESMAAAIIQACIDEGQCQPIAAEKLYETLQRYDNYRLMPGSYWDGFHILCESGDIEVVDFGDAHYVVPSPLMVSRVLGHGSRVMWTDEYIEQPVPAQRVEAPVARRGLLAAIRHRLGFA